MAIRLLNPRAGSSLRYLIVCVPLLVACGVDSPDAPTSLAPRTAQLERGGRSARTVSPSGADVGDCIGSPCKTINYAISQAGLGDVISVSPGTYHEAVQVAKRLVLVGHDATIDAAGQSTPPNGVVISGDAAAGTSLSGFTVQHAGLEGIFVDHTTGITVADNTVIHNDAYGPFNPLCVDQPDDCGEAIHLQSVTNSVVRNNLVQNNIGGILLTDEEGPTYGNLIADNRVLDNTLDCGITLASHHFNLKTAATADVAGVYRNTVLHNTSNGNGAAGIGVFAGPPGAAAWENVVTGNTAMHNGFAGIMIHSHTPAQYVNDNVVTNNTLAFNGIDDDNPFDHAPTGISIFSAVVPIPRTVVAANRISDQHDGINAVNAVQLLGLPSNKYATSVQVPVVIH
jgi:parallel beta-helix repeat protein